MRSLIFPAKDKLNDTNPTELLTNTTFLFEFPIENSVFPIHIIFNGSDFSLSVSALRCVKSRLCKEKRFIHHLNPSP